MLDITREYAKKRRRLKGKLIPFKRWKDVHEGQKIKVEEPMELNEANAHDTSISSTILDEIIMSCNGDDLVGQSEEAQREQMRAFEVLLRDDRDDNGDKEDQGQVQDNVHF